MNVNRSRKIFRIRDMSSVCLLAFSLLLFGSSALACSCAPYPADEAEAVAMAYERADAVFLGTVTGVRSKRLQPLSVRDATFELSSSWKGLSSYDGAVVRSADGELACGFNFRKSNRYLVFAHWDADQGILWTNMCELTREESEATGLIKVLDELKEQEEADHHDTGKNATQPRRNYIL